jgi:hypothetical protein
MKIVNILFLLSSLAIATWSLPALPRHAPPKVMDTPRFDFHQDYFTVPDNLAPAKPVKKSNSIYSWFASLVTTADTVIIDFNCTIKDVSQCQKARRAYKSAAKLLSSVIKFKRPIKVKAIYTSFCEEHKECNPGTLGQATSPSYFNLREPDTDSEFWYPQALAKQISTRELQWNDHDIIAQFNADVDKENQIPRGMSKFWFSDDKNKIHPRQYDFEYVYVSLSLPSFPNLLSVLHELLHGLGILSFWNVFNPGEYFSDNPQHNTRNYDAYENALSPMLLFREAPRSNEIRGISLPFIFDKFIYEKRTNTRIVDTYLTQFKSLNLNCSYAQWTKSFLQNRAYNEGRRLYKLSMTKNSLVFRFPEDGKSMNKTGELFVETSYEPFKAGSSLSHFDKQTYANTEEFLMRPEAEPGKSLKQITPKGLFPIGVKTRKMLRALGYNVVMNGLPAYGIGNHAAKLGGPLTSLLIIFGLWFW